MSIIIGSARIDENGNASGGAAGDQKQTTSTNDTKGEVSMQAMYTHSKGWYILRPKSVSHANAIAEKMVKACNNANIGYDQGNRLGIITYGIATTKKTECDCSSLVRACVKEATSKDPGDFTTANEATSIAATGLFQNKIAYVSQASTPVFNGDILVTKTKGHTVIVVGGNQRSTDSGYYPKYTGTSASIVTALAAVGEANTSLAYRKQIAASNGIDKYTGTAEQNTKMVNLLKAGTLKRVSSASSTSSGSTYYSKYTGSASSIVDALAAVGEKDTSLSHRKKIASANGISEYTGTATQNSKLMKLLKAGTLKKA